jgi:hypothetical protein
MRERENFFKKIGRGRGTLRDRRMMSEREGELKKKMREGEE